MCQCCDMPFKIVSISRNCSPLILHDCISSRTSFYNESLKFVFHLQRNRIINVEFGKIRKAARAAEKADAAKPKKRVNKKPSNK